VSARLYEVREPTLSAQGKERGSLVQRLSNEFRVKRGLLREV